MRGHRGPVTALALQHDEKGFFSAGLDGEALVRSVILICLGMEIINRVVKAMGS